MSARTRSGHAGEKTKLGWYDADDRSPGHERALMWVSVNPNALDTYGGAAPAAIKHDRAVSEINTHTVRATE